MSLFEKLPGTRSWRDRRQMDLCRETFRRVQAIVDGEVPHDAHTKDLLAHLDDCVRCGVERAALEELKVAIARVEARECDEIADRLRPTLERLLREER